MGEIERWHLITYDIGDPQRWRKAYRLLRGFGERLQYSVFRCRLTDRQLEQLRWELEKRLAPEDKLLIVGLCDGCAQRMFTRNRPEAWKPDDKRFRVL